MLTPRSLREEDRKRRSELESLRVVEGVFEQRSGAGGQCFGFAMGGFLGSISKASPEY